MWCAQASLPDDIYDAWLYDQTLYVAWPQALAGWAACNVCWWADGSTVWQGTARLA